MRYLKLWVLVLLALVLVACGGGGNPGATSGSTPVVSTAATVEVLASSLTLDSADSATGITISALVKDVSNNSLTSQAVVFTASSGVLSSVSSVTNASTGLAAATLTTGSDHANRNITVTVTSGSVSGTVVIAVAGTSLTVTGSSSVLLNAIPTFNVGLKDSAGVAISGAALTVTSALGNAISLATVATNTSGTDTFTYTAARAGSDILTVSGGGTTTTYAVAVSSNDFSFTTPSDAASIAIGSSQNVSVNYSSGGVAQVNKTIVFSTTRGTFNGGVASTVSAVTDISGIATAAVSSTTAGAAKIIAQISGGASITRAVSFVAVTPTNIVLQSNVSAIAPNASGSAANSVTLTATVKDENGNAVQNATVSFSIVSDTSNGTIGSGLGTTNANGVVTDTYIPGSSSTAADGVVLKATVTTNNSITSTAKLTVSARALFITIATGNTIANLDENTYSKPFTVSVNDANGAAVPSQAVVLSAYPTYYYKGYLLYSGGVWNRVNSTAATCANEDANRDGTLQAGEDDSRNVNSSTGNLVASGNVSLTGAGNGDGKLTPGSPGSIPASSVTTDTNGMATFVLNYGEQYAPWLRFEIKARATVAGTETSKIYIYEAGGVASDFTSATVAPSGDESPFGYSTSCFNPY